MPKKTVVEDSPAEAAERLAPEVSPEEVAADLAEREAQQDAEIEAVEEQLRAEGVEPNSGNGTSGKVTMLADVSETRPGGGTIVSDVSLDLDEVNTITVRLGGHTWRAVEPSIATNKILAMAAGGPIEDDDDGSAAVRTLESIYQQVKHILFDVETGRPPSREFVEEHLTGRNFGRLMNKLNDTDGDQGNARRG